MRADNAAMLCSTIYAASAPTFQSIYGALLTEILDVRPSGAVAVSAGKCVNWTGSKLGVIVPAPTTPRRPVYAADGSNFRGMPVVQTTSASSVGLVATGLSGILASGTRPYHFGVFRMVGSVAAAQAPFSLCRVGAQQQLGYQRSGAQVISGYFNFQPCAAPVSNTSVHFYEAWSDATNLNVAVDGVVSSVVASGLTAVDVDSLGVGCLAYNSQQWADAMHAVHGWCVSVPSIAQRAAALALARADWGF